MAIGSIVKRQFLPLPLKKSGMDLRRLTRTIYLYMRTNAYIITTYVYINSFLSLRWRVLEI